MTHEHFVVGTFADESAANRAVETVIAADCPMDQISVLGRSVAEGDDVLGVVEPGIARRMEVWGKQGALWGGIFGLLAGAAWASWLPVVGPALAAGHILAALELGASGAAVGGAGLAGGAVVSQLAVVLHRRGLPRQALADLHRRIEAGQVLIVIRVGDADEARRFSDVLAAGTGEPVLTLPDRRWTSKRD
jgi:hypothetical protein